MAQEQNGRKERARRALEVLAQALRRGEVVEEPEGDGMVLQVPGSPIPMATGRLEAWGKGEVLALEALLVVAAPGDREALSRLREDRPPRLHFRREAPAEEALALVANLTRLLPLPRKPSPTLAWWGRVLKKGEENALEAVGRIAVGA